MSSNRLIIVSNRLPFRISAKKGQLELIPSAGGLVSSIKSYIQNSSQGSSDGKHVWVGASDVSEKKFNQLFPEGKLYFEEFELFSVFIPTVTRDKFYNGFCNDTIWPLFHYFPSFARFSDEYYREYEMANILFCQKITEIYRPGDIIWIHDYHLMLLPAMLRKIFPEATIGFFLHIPFPSFEIFRLLPGKCRMGILQGMLGADVVGFHTDDYVQHFLKSVRQLLGLDNRLRVISTPDRNVTVDAFPISIDYDKFNKASIDTDTFGERNKIKKRFYDTKLIVSVDRLDYAKGLLHRLESFELFLESYPDYRTKVVYILLVVPSRDIIARYKETKKEIEGLVSRINGKYGGIDWTPVVYQYKSLDLKKLVALYLAADVALITPMRDGMNLVAKEFVTSRTDKRGVLILSETAGASMELSEAVFVNPTDRVEIAGALRLALSMPVDEQIRRNEAMQKRLRKHDVMRWAENFISQMISAGDKQEKLKIKKLTESICTQLAENYRLAKKRLLLFDYDGTLMPLAQLPQLACPDESLINLLKRLAEDPDNEVAIVSGRSVHELDEWFGLLPIGLVGEHGAFYKKKEQEWKQSRSVNIEWKPSLLPVFRMFEDRCEGSFVEEKKISLAWHYRNADTELGFLRSRELINALIELSAHLDFQIIEGHKVIEVRPKGIDKGIALTLWSKEANYDFILAIGDDRTDEDLFRAVSSNGYTIRVGLTQSIARYNLKNQYEVQPFLTKLLDHSK